MLKASTAQKTKLYDMYVRFFRWASDRIVDEGVVAFITNRSFIDAHTADGFRRIVTKDFAEGWVVDLGGDYKKHGIGGSGNVFGIGTGVAISFWIKRKDFKGKMKLSYLTAPSATGDDKLSWLAGRSMGDADWQRLGHRDDAAWLDIPDENWDELIPLADKSIRGKEVTSNTIFSLFSLGVATNRDEWVYDRSLERLKFKISKLVAEYDAVPTKPLGFPNVIKWSETLKRRKNGGENEAVDWTLMRRSAYRPFEKRFFYQSSIFIDRPGQSSKVFPPGSANRAICFSDISPRAPFTTHAVGQIHDLNYGGSIGGFQHVPRYRYTKSGERIDNITDWAVAQFAQHYKTEVAEAQFNDRVGNGGIAQEITLPDGTKHSLSIELGPVAWSNDNRVPGITKDAIFAYCYAVLHDPLYREKYALNLKREFPRIPFYADFARWVAWGEALLTLHIDYEQATPLKLTRVDISAPKRAKGTHPRAKLKSDAATGLVMIDEDTHLTGIPSAAWTYRLGNRSAIDWVLDQHKEKTLRDPTIRAEFDTYRFADYKESMIDLLAKVIRVSVETVAITEAMSALERAG